jgi:hypothetical protein
VQQTSCRCDHQAVDNELRLLPHLLNDLHAQFIKPLDRLPDWALFGSTGSNLAAQHSTAQHSTAQHWSAFDAASKEQPLLHPAFPA